MTRRRRALVALAACSAVLAGACSDSGTGAPARPMRLRLVEGTAEITSSSGTRRVQQSDAVAVGDRIAVSRQGVAELSLARGVAIELAGAQVAVDTGRKVTLDRGRVLVVAKGPVAVETDPVTIRSNGGIFRVDRDLSTRVAAYLEDARIDGPEAPLPVPAYYQAVVTAGLVPRSPDPLRVDPVDRWDLRFLKGAIDIDARLDNLSRGLDAQLGPGAGPDVYRRLLPAGFQVSLLTPFGSLSKADVLVGSLIAYQASGGEGTARILDGVFAMKREGFTWGIVAQRFGVGQQALFSLLLDSVSRAGIVDQGRGPALASPGRQAPSASTSPSPRTSPSTSPAPQSSPSPNPQPSPSPASPGPLTPVTNLLDQVLEELLGGLLRPPSSPTPGR